MNDESELKQLLCDGDRIELIEKGDGVWTKDKWKATYKNCSGIAEEKEDAIEALMDAIREAEAFGEMPDDPIFLQEQAS